MKMTYSEFREFVRTECMYETVYDDSEGREILVIRLLDAFTLLNKATGNLIIKSANPKDKS